MSGYASRGPHWVHDVNVRCPGYWGTPSCGQTIKRFDYAHIEAALAMSTKRHSEDQARRRRAPRLAHFGDNHVWRFSRRCRFASSAASRSRRCIESCFTCHRARPHSDRNSHEDSHQDARRAHRRLAAANAMHQVRLPGVPPVCRGHRRWRSELQPVPAGRRRGRRASRGAARQAGDTARYLARRRARAPARRHRRERVHRLHPVHAGVSCRCNRRCSQTDAHGHRATVHGLRFVRAALPRRLHRDDSRHRRRHRLGRLEPARRGRGPRAS